jgi:GNAT superfamily N-acetyltransferase
VNAQSGEATYWACAPMASAHAPNHDGDRRDERAGPSSHAFNQPRPEPAAQPAVRPAYARPWVSREIADIEEALFAQWAQFGRWSGGTLHDHDGLLWYETPITHLPYNGVVRTWLRPAAADAAIAAVTERLRAREAHSLWFAHPTATPDDLGDRLAAHGLAPVEEITCMSLDLSGWEPEPPPAGVAFEEVVDERALDEYTDLTVGYWEIPAHERELVAELQRALGPGRVPGHRYLARLDGQAVGKGYLSLAGPAGVAAIYGMSVRPEARGRGIAAGMTAQILRHAKDLGCARAVLHSTPMAVGLYRRIGFVERCPLTVYATAPLWSGDD